MPDFRVLSRQSLFDTRAFNQQFFHKTHDVGNEGEYISFA
jgi:hypothetical protein